MESREASAQAPTAAGLRLYHDLRAAYLQGGRYEGTEAREVRMREIIEGRRDEVTMTLLLMLPDGDPIAYALNNSLLGMKWDGNQERPVVNPDCPPLHPEILLQSLRKSCAKCRAYATEEGAPRCERQDQYHDVTYKTSTRGGTGKELNLISALGGSAENYVLCEVDPDTGYFTLPPLEAKKALREWGENAVRATRRWKDRVNRKGDRWQIREVAHWNLYANAAPGIAAPHQAVKSMSAD